MKRQHIVLIGSSVILMAIAITGLVKSSRKNPPVQTPQTVALVHVAKTTNPAHPQPHTTQHRQTSQPVLQHHQHKTIHQPFSLLVAERAADVQKELPEPHFTYLPKSTLFSTDYLETQTFIIPCNRDTEIVAKAGMKITIPAEAFVDKTGRGANGRVCLQVKEAFSASDIVLANLVTKKGKDLLESGGMYYLNAMSNRDTLAVAPGKYLHIEVPTPQKEEGMELYKGRPTAAGLDWTEPVAMNNIPQATPVQQAPPAQKAHDVTRKKAGTQKAKKVEIDSLGWMTSDAFNAFKEDTQLKYLMTTNRMGWANIDRLYHDPRSRQVYFVTTVENNKGYDRLYISMMFKSRRIYLPGYQKTDGTYSFTHGDYEEPVLPVGEQAIVMVSAYKNNEHYFSMQNVLIDDVMKVNLVPQLTKEEDIRAQISKSL